MPKNSPLDSLSETNGAVATAAPTTLPTHKVDASFDKVESDTDETSEAETDSARAAKLPPKTVAKTSPPPPPRQAHGAIIRGPISSVQQLIGRNSVAKGSMGSFETLSDYRDHIDTLTLGELHAHAIDSMETPIYDTSVLKTRLERKWTEVSARNTPGRGVGQSRGVKGYTSEQNAAAQALLKKMLNGKRS